MAKEPAEIANKKDAPEGEKASGRSGRIAVVYAEGEIVDGEGDEGGEIGGTRFARELRRLRLEDNVKAVVLRVNSPGGTASASEMIQREVRLLKKVKPVVISMGTYAASGGYWIAAYGDRIFAEPTTVTGSIGVFGIQFDVQKLSNNFGLTFDSVKTGKFADAITITRPKTPEEMAVFQRIVDWAYEEFIAKVVEGRSLKREFVEEIAQGRVWSGAEARSLGWSMSWAAWMTRSTLPLSKAQLGSNYRLVEFPKKKEFAEAMQEFVEKITPHNARATGLAGQIATRLEDELKLLRTFNDPHGLYARLPHNLMIQ